MNILYLIIIITIIIIPLSLFSSSFAGFTRSVLKNYKISTGKNLYPNNELIDLLKDMQKEKLSPEKASSLIITYQNYGITEFSKHYDALKKNKEYIPLNSMNKTTYLKNNKYQYKDIELINTLKNEYKLMSQEAYSSFKDLCKESDIVSNNSVYSELKYLIYFAFDIIIAAYFYEQDNGDSFRDAFINAIGIYSYKKGEMEDRIMEYSRIFKYEKDIVQRNSAFGNNFAKNIGNENDALVVLWAYNLFSNSIKKINEIIT